MKEIHAWVPWFKELANKIAEGGEAYLASSAKQVVWRKDGNRQLLLKHGDKNIDPFTFIYSVAARSKESTVRAHLYPSIQATFGMHSVLNALDENPIRFIQPLPEAALFHKDGNGDPELLWRLFRDAVKGPRGVNPKDFEGAFDIPNVATRKLTQTLFLINPEEFIPITYYTTSILPWPPEVRSKVRLQDYVDRIESAHGAFPDCKLFEISLFAYLVSKQEITIIADRCFQVSTNVYDDGEDHWDGFVRDNSVYTGGPGTKKMYPLDEPQPGDIVMVRFGTQEGRGIGIVQRNDYTDGWAENRKLHVLWLNKRTAELAGSTPRFGFSRANSPTRDAFRDSEAYGETFKLIERLSVRRDDLTDHQPTEPRTLHLASPPVKHPRNRILYGPPGTGKTWNAVNHALAIIDGEVVRSNDDQEYRMRFHHLRFNLKTGEGQIAMVTFHQNFAYEDFIEGIRPKLEGSEVAYKLQDGIFKCIASAARDAAEAETDERFVLVIDEINRGNIAKIFGELITLIEDSRRLGQDDATEVTLPYSGKTFSVPENLYIIGTMNTADRSIQLLDTALRRRFTFMEMMPNPQHHKIQTDIDGVNCRDLLTTINKRVAALLDREHQIGHTYLFDVADMEELSFTFQNRIFPLLQEYFFDDWLKIRAVLGENAFVQVREPETLLLNANLVDDEHRTYERLADDDKRWLDPREYRQIYGHARTNGTEPGS